MFDVRFSFPFHAPTPLPSSRPPAHVAANRFLFDVQRSMLNVRRSIFFPFPCPTSSLFKSPSRARCCQPVPVRRSAFDVECSTFDFLSLSMPHLLSLQVALPRTLLPTGSCSTFSVRC